MPRLSVLIPAWNASAHLASTIRTTLIALPRDAEIVVYDDASEDATAAVAASFSDRRVRVIVGDSQLGPARGMNRLLGATDSEYVARIDADDLCHPFRFALQRREIERGADVAFGTLLHFGGRYRYPRWLSRGRLGPQAVRVSLLLSNPLGHSTMFARRSALHGEQSYQDVPTEDYVLWTTLAAEGARIVRSAAPLASYRHHRGQLTATADWQQRRVHEDAAVRRAYSDLGAEVTGVRPSAELPLRGAWTDAGDVEYLAALRAAVDALDGGEGRFVAELAKGRGLR
ncbi:glycosyltransferase family 2 protein [Agromyces soli]|uniref:Glycosyltransferase n=1 Tax=Agromyces soli TaxID=659012 RepID=A0ABY4AS80_9MICO|nr:glycosyltransferase family 2 protein [Agromyces soli]UOE26052.1 glycosyltransferase [Agromyces soli]